MDGTTPIITKKKALIALAVFLVLMGVGTFLLLYQGPSQNIPDDSEPMLNFAAEGSKIAGIQKLITSGGLSWEQYKKVYVALNEKLPEMEPESRYFYFIEESLEFAATRTDSAGEVVEVPFAPERGEDPEAGSELDSGLAGNMIVDENTLDASDDPVTDTLLFTMRSETRTEYDVEVYTAGELETAKVKIEKK